MKRTLALIGLLAVATSVFSQTTTTSAVPQKLPVDSFAALKAYALSRVDTLYGGVSSMTVSGTSWYSVAYTNADGDAELMTELCAQQTIKCSVDPREQINIWNNFSGAFGDYGWTLFSGSKQFCLEKGVGGIWRVPTNAVPKLEMSDWIPYGDLPGVAYAYIAQKDESGNVTNFYSFNDDSRVYDGFILLGRKHLNQNGTLIADMKDGRRMMFDLPSGQPALQVQLIASGIKPVVEGVRSLSVNTTNVGYIPGDELVRAAYTSNCIVSVTFPKGSYEPPTGVAVIDMEILSQDPLAEWTHFNPLSGPIVFKVEEGRKIFIRFDYKIFPAPLTPSGGKG